MKMLMAVLVVKVIIYVFEKNKTETVENDDSWKQIIHPAEFMIR